MTSPKPRRDRNGSARMSPRTSSARSASLARVRRVRARASICADQIDSHERGAGPDDRHGDAAGAAAELEHRTILRQGQTLPEPDVAPRLRPRVLPVVEGRIGIPPFRAVAHLAHWRLPIGDCRLSRSATGDWHWAIGDCDWQSTVESPIDDSIGDRQSQPTITQSQSTIVHESHSAFGIRRPAVGISAAGSGHSAVGSRQAQSYSERCPTVAKSMVFWISTNAGPAAAASRAY